MTCILLHGLGQTPDAWGRTAAALPLGLDVHCPDLTACLAGPDPSYAALYRSFSACCRRLPPPLHLWGLSLGGVLALHYALDHPGAVGSLALMGAQYKMPKGLLRLQSAMFRLLPAAAFPGLSKQGVIALSRSMMDLDFTRDLPRLSCPLLVLCGQRDRVNRPAALRLKALVPNARLSILPGAGHEVNVDAPEALSKELGAFLQSLA